MALRVWLPLNGTLENKGISDVTVTNNGATIDNNGKIGKCYYFNRSIPNYLKIDNPFPLGSINKLSMAFWIKIPSNASGNNQVVHIGNGSGWNNNRFTCFIRGSTSALVFSCGDGVDTSDAHSTKYNCQSTALTLNEWTHVVCIYANGIMRIYLNGTLDKEYITSIIPSFTGVSYIGIGAAPNAGEPATVYVNDVRIYDHALSPKEVKEISQGLILHYKLDGFSGGAGENLLANSMPSNSLSGWSSAGTNWSNSIVDCDITNSKKCVRCTYTGTTQVSGGIHHPVIDWNSMEDGEIYTLSAYLRASKSCTITFKNEMMSSASSGTFTPTITQSWQRYEVSGPINKAATYHSNVMYVVTSAAEQNMWIEACMVKLEKGSTSTAWTLTSSEFGVDSAKITDSSGYGNDGTIVGTLTTQQDSPRYKISSYLNKKKISCSNGFLTTNDPVFTVSLWFKLYSNITYTAYADLISFTTESYSAQPFRLELCGSPVGQNLMWFRGPSGSTGGFNVGSSGSGWYTLDEWHHIALVSNGNKQYISYFDGQQTNTFNGSSYTWTPTGGVSIGDTAEGTASMSDFRIYATALSAEDILDLYHTPANIDNLGNLHSFEFNETQTSTLSDFTLSSNNWVADGVTASYGNDPTVGPIVTIIPSSSSRRIYHNVSNVWTTGTTYLVSFLAKCSGPGTITPSRSLADNGPAFSITTDWKQYYGLITSTATPGGGTLSLTCAGTNTYYISNIKLELADQNLISILKNGITKENWLDQINFTSNASFLKTSSNIIANDFIEK